MGRKIEPLASKFWSKVNKLGLDDCWNWFGRIKPDHGGHPAGYGLLYITDHNKGRMPNGNTRQTPKRAHRISWELHYGAIPENLLVLHKCDNRRCVNPNHLFLGTNNDNIQDMIKKGRHNPRGIKTQLKKIE